MRSPVESNRVLTKARIFATTVAISFLSCSFFTAKAQAISKEIITSATYGVLAGTIVGSATLAFTENPGENLNRIARGASIGLYAGLLLGAYVTYGVSDSQDAYDDYDDEVRLMPKLPKLAVFPITRDNKLDGAAAYWRVHSF